MLVHEKVRSFKMGFLGFQKALGRLLNASLLASSVPLGRKSAVSKKLMTYALIKKDMGEVKKLLKLVSMLLEILTDPLNQKTLAACPKSQICLVWKRADAQLLANTEKKNQCLNLKSLH